MKNAKYKVGDFCRYYNNTYGEFYIAKIVGIKKKILGYAYLLEHYINWTDLRYTETVTEEIKERKLYSFK